MARPATRRARLVDQVERLGTRMSPTLLASVGSLLVSARRREPCWASPTEGGWIHRYREGTTAHPRLGGPSARLQDAAARDHFLYDYEPGPGETVFDIGAGVGGEVRLFSRLVGAAGRVVSVEAHPRTFRLLEHTIALNALTNVTALQLAVTGERGTVHISDDVRAHVSNGLTSDASAGIAVPGHTLPDIMQMVGVSRIDLLAMNIEGAELPALQAALGCLDRVDHLAVSCHDFKADYRMAAGLGDTGGEDWLRTYEPVVDLLRGAGFRIRTRAGDPRPMVRYYVYASR